MKALALLVVAAPLLWSLVLLARHAWNRAHEDYKAACALRLAEDYPPFARALGTVLKLGGQLPGSSPWHRPETRDRHVYVMGGR